MECSCAGQQLAGLLALLHSCFDVKGMLAGKHPYVLYYLAAAMRPRMLMTVDGEGKLLPVSVRVGQAIDTVAQVRIIARLTCIPVKGSRDVFADECE